MYVRDIILFSTIVSKCCLLSRICATALSGSTIPHNVWITMKQIHTNLPAHINKLIDNNPEWKFNIIDNAGMEKFMRSEYANTSIYWAYKRINPQLGAAKADIWRLAVLYKLGGVYIDADSFVEEKLSVIVRPTDSFVFGAEGNPFEYCFSDKYHLNATEAFAVKLFSGRQLLQWLVVSQPEHPMLARTMKNIVDVVRRIDQGLPVLSPLLKNKLYTVVCATGPGVFTASILEEIRDNPNVQYRYAGVDFKEYRARFKVVSANHVYGESKSYSILMGRGASLLTGGITDADEEGSGNIAVHNSGVVGGVARGRKASDYRATTRKHFVI